MLNKDSVVLDVGCGTGRWAKYISNKVKLIEAIDPSDAIFSAADFNRGVKNVRITHCGVDNIPFDDELFDFVFSLGVFHHVPDTEQALINAVCKLKKNGFFLIYLYYNLDNRGVIFKLIFKLSDIFRKIISRLPSIIKMFICDLIAISIYLPFIFLAKAFKILFPKQVWYAYFPLSYYRDKSFKIIRNDALDRFGTPLEKRFSKDEIAKMLKKAGIENIIFSQKEPYWHAVGQKK